MNNQQAKEILLLYRPGTADQDDPEFAAALALAKGDPELTRWFNDHCAVQQGLRARFQQIPIPEGLKEQILSERKVRTSPALSRKAALFLATAAALFLLLAGATFYLRPHKPDTFSEFRTRMAETVLREYPKMDKETNNLNEIRRFLAQTKAPGDYVLPPALEKASGTGCAVLKWRGQTVSMICFSSGMSTDPSEPNDLFLFVIDRKAVTKAPPANSPQFAQLNRLATVSWTSGDRTYVLGGFGDQEFIRKYL